MIADLSARFRIERRHVEDDFAIEPAGSSSTSLLSISSATTRVVLQRVIADELRRMRACSS